MSNHRKDAFARRHQKSYWEILSKQISERKNEYWDNDASPNSSGKPIPQVPSQFGSQSGDVGNQESMHFEEPQPYQQLSGSGNESPHQSVQCSKFDHSGRRLDGLGRAPPINVPPRMHPHRAMGPSELHQHLKRSGATRMSERVRGQKSPTEYPSSDESSGISIGSEASRLTGRGEVGKGRDGRRPWDYTDTGF